MVQEPSGSQLSLRLLTVAFGVPVTLGALWLGGAAWASLLAVVIALGTIELSRLCQRSGMPVPAPIAAAGGLGYLAVAWRASAPPEASFSAGWAVVAALVIAGAALHALLAAASRRPAPVSLIGIAAGALFTSLYVGGGLSYLYLLRSGPAGPVPAWLALTGTWATDTAAYLAGRALGRYRLLPAISPGKTVEGAIAGLLAATAATAGVARLFGYPLLWGAALGVVIGSVSQIGDLAESAMKRQAGVKDSGDLLPGHGGILDRFDGLIWVAPAVYYALYFLGP